MRANVQHTYGSAQVLSVQTVDRPTVDSDQVLVEVHAAGVDRGVWHLMTGRPYLIRLLGFGLTKPKNPIPGLDLAGVVVAVGSDVTRFTVGDEVFGIGTGTFAEYAVADEKKLSRKPANVSFEQAGAAAVSGITALQALTDVGKIESGQHVLVLGASGGVGSYAVQLAKALGGKVTGVASTKKVDMVGSIGADHVIDYTKDDFVDGGQTFDLIIDTGGRNSLSRLRSVLSPKGTLVIVGAEGGNRFTGGISRQLRAMMLSPFIGQRLTSFISTEHHSSIDRLAALLESGAVTPAVGESFSLDRAAEALHQLEAGVSAGKSVVVVRSHGAGSPGRASDGGAER